MRQASGYSGDGWVNSLLYRVAATGNVVGAYENSCARSDAHYNMFNHECRSETVARADGAVVGRALTLAYAVRSDFGNWTTAAALNKNLGETFRASYGGGAVPFVADKIVAWDDGAGVASEVYDLFDYFNPVDDAYASEAYASLDAACRVAGGKEAAVEWFHASSVGKAPNGDYLVTSRNLDLVVALSADGSGVAWTLAADPASVGARYASLELRDASGAPSDRAKFYQPHAVSMPADDRLLLVDDGRFRANCSSADETETCYSRAVEYALDFEAGTATLAWEFEFPYAVAAVGERAAELDDVYNVAGGSVVKRSPASYFVAFNSVDDGSGDGQPTLAFDVGADGAYVAEYKLPRVDRGCGSYRAMPSDSVNLETRDRPW